MINLKEDEKISIFIIESRNSISLEDYVEDFCEDEESIIDIKFSTRKKFFGRTIYCAMIIYISHKYKTA